MSVLFLCDVFDKENSQEVISNAKRAVEFSSIVVQEKLIEGFKLVESDFTVLSAPAIGSYPNASKIKNFKGFSKPSEYNYVNFNNLWGMRNFSRARALKKAIRGFIKLDAKEKLIVVYSVHTPLIESAVYAKKRDSKIKICLIVPDLAQYMNLSKKKSLLYRIAKYFDIKNFNRLNKFVDSYMLLTQLMKDKININGKPYIVKEGVISQKEIDTKRDTSKTNEKGEKYIVYTGKLNQSFGIKILIDAFLQMEQPDIRLVLCGLGDIYEYALNMATVDHRIMVLGQVTPTEAKEWVNKANVLVNPRQNDQEYTKYSFPSKNIEYLITGNSVVAYMLDGMKDIYSQFIYTPKDNSVESLRQTLESVIESGNTKGDFLAYAKENLLSNNIVEQILEMNNERN